MTELEREIAWVIVDDLRRAPRSSHDWIDLWSSSKVHRVLARLRDAGAPMEYDRYKHLWRLWTPYHHPLHLWPRRRLIAEVKWLRPGEAWRRVELLNRELTALLGPLP